MLIHQGGHSLQKAPELTVAHKSKTLPRIQNTSQNPRTFARIQNPSQKTKNTPKNSKYFLDSKTLLDSGKYFGFWEVCWILGSVLVSGTYSGFWDVFWILGCVFELSEVLLDCGTCFGFWRCFWILGHVLSVRATTWTWWSLTKKCTVKSDCICCGSINAYHWFKFLSFRVWLCTIISLNKGK